MNHETIQVATNKSGSVPFSRLVVSVRRVEPYSSCEVVIGYPGLPNVKDVLKLGDAVLYETTEDGILEVRATALAADRAEFLVSQVSPRIGLAAGLLSDDPSNLPFSGPELARVAESVSDAKARLANSGEFAREQLALIGRKLDEIESASARLGRKDWLNYVAGSLTALCISAAFAPEVTRTIFSTVNSAFAWFFTNAPVLLLR